MQIIALPHISHSDLVTFAEDDVNLSREHASKYRKQVTGLRERLENKLSQEPDFELRKMLLSGSLAKGTALKQLNDIDVALYVFQEKPPTDMPKFIDWLVTTLQNLYPNMNPSQIIPQDFSVRISFAGSGLNVDLVPISYDGNESWDGHLLSSETGRWLKTNIKRHLEFIGNRRPGNPNHYTQLARLLKHWIKERKKDDEDFRFKSFLVELLLAHLVDSQQIELYDYPEALAQFFDYIIRSNLDDLVAFSDYYQLSEVWDDGKPIRVFDPVNPDNNIADDYDAEAKAAIASAAGEAADAIDAARFADTKAEALRYWRKVFGATFG